MRKSVTASNIPQSGQPLNTKPTKPATRKPTNTQPAKRTPSSPKLRPQASGLSPILSDLRQAENLYNSSQYAPCWSLCKSNLKHKDASTFYYMGKIKMSERDYSRALNLFNSSSKLKSSLIPSSALAPMLAFNKIICLEGIYHKSKTSDKLNDLKLALESFKKNYPGSKYIGSVQARLKKYR